jgi:hypothetical protein
MIPRISVAFAALLYAATTTAVCTKLQDCPQLEKLKTNECQAYHHFLARGSTSPYPGHVIETVGKICDQLNNATHPTACGYEDLEYPAMNGGERWCISAHEGAINGAAQMRNYTARCPDSHLIVMGFSQGGSVQLDVLGGGGGELWGCMQEDNPAMNISSAPGSKGRSIHSHLPYLTSLLTVHSCCSCCLWGYSPQRRAELYFWWRRGLRWRRTSYSRTERRTPTLRRCRQTSRILSTPRSYMRTAYREHRHEVPSGLLREVGRRDRDMGRQ